MQDIVRAELELSVYLLSGCQMTKFKRMQDIVGVSPSHQAVLTDCLSAFWLSDGKSLFSKRMQDIVGVSH